MATFWRTALLMPAVLLLQACTMWSEHPVRHWSDATGGESLERNFWIEVKQKDWNELERHLAGNYIRVTPRGALDRTAALELLKQFEVTDYVLSDFQVELNGRSMIVAYTLILKGNGPRGPFPSEPVHMLAVWQQQKTGWVALAHSVVGEIK